jgi:hypothetical protein
VIKPKTTNAVFVAITYSTTSEKKKEMIHICMLLLTSLFASSMLIFVEKHGHIEIIKSP